MKGFARHLWPDTLVGRAVLVLLTGLLFLQLAGLAVYSINRGELASRLGSRQMAERIAGVVRLVEDTPEADRGRVIQAMERPGLRIGWGQSAMIPFGDGAPESIAVEEELTHRLSGQDVRISMRPPPPPSPVPPLMTDGPDPGPGFHHGRPPLTRVAVHLQDGSWLNFVADAQPMSEPLWRPRFFAPLSGGLLVVMILSVLAVRRAAKPLGLLAAAAQRLGRDVKAPPIPITGPREVREAALAFNDMQTRLRRFVEDRTQMIAAISHDLRTPITRLKLRAEFVEDDEQREKMLADLDEMEAMIASTLAFARDDAAREARRSVDLAALLKTLCGEFTASYDGPSSLTVTAGPTAMKRAFANLLDNARKYGHGAALVLSAVEGQVTALITDCGPGIPDAEMERVFAPFYRVENSRNRDTGGTGLGLAVARTAIRAHGGDITLANHPAGGLCVTVTLPH